MNKITFAGIVVILSMTFSLTALAQIPQAITIYSGTPGGYINLKAPAGLGILVTESFPMTTDSTGTILVSNSPGSQTIQNGLTLGLSDSLGGELIFIDSSHGYTTNIKAGIQSGNIFYTLPTGQGGDSMVLTNDGSGNLYWHSFTIMNADALSGSTWQAPQAIGTVTRDTAYVTVFDASGTVNINSNSSDTTTIGNTNTGGPINLLSDAGITINDPNTGVQINNMTGGGPTLIGNPTQSGAITIVSTDPDSGVKINSGSASPTTIGNTTSGGAVAILSDAGITLNDLNTGVQINNMTGGGPTLIGNPTQSGSITIVSTDPDSGVKINSGSASPTTIGNTTSGGAVAILSDAGIMLNDLNTGVQINNMTGGGPTLIGNPMQSGSITIVSTDPDSGVKINSGSASPTTIGNTTSGGAVAILSDAGIMLNDLNTGVQINNMTGGGPTLIGNPMQSGSITIVSTDPDSGVKINSGSASPTTIGNTTSGGAVAILSDAGIMLNDLNTGVQINNMTGGGPTLIGNPTQSGSITIVSTDPDSGVKINSGSASPTTIGNTTSGGAVAILSDAGITLNDLNTGVQINNMTGGGPTLIGNPTQSGSITIVSTDPDSGVKINSGSASPTTIGNTTSGGAVAILSDAGITLNDLNTGVQINNMTGGGPTLIGNPTQSGSITIVSTDPDSGVKINSGSASPTTIGNTTSGGAVAILSDAGIMLNDLNTGVQINNMTGGGPTLIGNPTQSGAITIVSTSDSGVAINAGSASPTTIGNTTSGGAVAILSDAGITLNDLNTGVQINNMTGGGPTLIGNPTQSGAITIVSTSDSGVAINAGSASPTTIGNTTSGGAVAILSDAGITLNDLNTGVQINNMTGGGPTLIGNPTQSGAITIVSTSDSGVAINAGSASPTTIGNTTSGGAVAILSDAGITISDDNTGVSINASGGGLTLIGGPIKLTGLSSGMPAANSFLTLNASNQVVLAGGGSDTTSIFFNQSVSQYTTPVTADTLFSIGNSSESTDDADANGGTINSLAGQKGTSANYANGLTVTATSNSLSGSRATGLTVSASGGGKNIAIAASSGSVLFSGTTGGTPSSGAGTRMEWIPALGALRVGVLDSNGVTDWDNSNIGTNSVALGNDVTASGAYSIAMGQNTTASGDYSTAMGWNASTNGQSSSFVYGDGSASVSANSPYTFTVLASGGTTFYSNAAGNTGVSFPANGGITVLGTNSPIILDTIGAGSPGQVLTSAGSGYSPTWSSVASPTNVVDYNDSTVQNTASPLTNYLFDIAYASDGVTSNSAQGAAINSISATGGTSNATGLTVNATANNGTATALQLTSQGGAVNNDIVGTGGSWSISSGGLFTTTGGANISGQYGIDILDVVTNSDAYNNPSIDVMQLDQYGNVNINTNGSTAATTIGNSTSGGIVTIASSADIEIQDNKTGVYVNAVSTATPSPSTTSPVVIGNDNSTGGVDIESGPGALGSPGVSINANGSGNTLIGYHAQATNASIAIGDYTIASGTSSIALGNNAKADSASSIAIGYFPQSTGTYSIALGNGTTSSGLASTSMGSTTIASGDYSTAMGASTTASGNYSTAMGWNASTNGQSSSFVYGDGSASVSANSPYTFTVLASGGTTFYSNAAGNTGVSFPANGGITVLGTNSPIILDTIGAGDSGQVLTSAGSGATPTWTTIASPNNVVQYGDTAQQNSALPVTNYLFNVSYATDAVTSNSASGAVINSVSGTGGGSNATGLTITASANGSGTATALQLNSYSGNVAYDVLGTNGAWSVMNGGLFTTTGGASITGPGEGDILDVYTNPSAPSNASTEIIKLDGYGDVNINAGSSIGTTIIGNINNTGGVDIESGSGNVTLNIGPGAGSTMIGQFAQASNTSIALGYETNASGEFSIAMGEAATASGNGSTAIGVGTAAKGGNSTAMGNIATANNGGSFVYGDGSAAVSDAAGNTFTVLASGGATFYSNSAQTAGITFPAGGGLTISGANSPITLDTNGPGNYGEVLTSTGLGSTPIWKSIALPSNVVAYDIASGQDSASDVYYLFNVGYAADAVSSNNSLGAVINSSSATGGNSSATGLTITATANSGTATALQLTSQNGEVDYDINGTANSWNISNIGLITTTGGASITGPLSGDILDANTNSSASSNASTEVLQIDGTGNININTNGSTAATTIGNSTSGGIINIESNKNVFIDTGSTASSTIIGNINAATTINANAVSIGNQAITTGTNFPVAIGNFVQSSGIGSVALGSGTGGYYTNATGNYSIALGTNNTALGDYSTTMGYITTASGEYSTAIGSNTVSSGIASIAMGESASASGQASFSMGLNTVASGDYSTAIGANASTNGKGGAFVYGDRSTNTVMTAANADEFDVRAAGGVNFYTNSGLTAGVSLPANGGLSLLDSTAPISLNGSVGTTGQVLTSAGSGATPTWTTALTTTTGVEYDLPTASTQNTSATGTDWLFNVAYSGSVTGSTAGAKITSTAVAGSSTATGLTVSASGGTSVSGAPDNIAIAVPSGSVLFSGTTGVTPASGAGTRMEWIPSLGALRAGSAVGTEWDGANIGQHSIGLGYQDKASAIGSTALGYSTTASGQYSTTLGDATAASGKYSTALGYNTTATGEFSTAMGVSSEADGTGATAMGYSTLATGNVSTAMGSNVSTNNKTGTFIYGDSSTATIMEATAANQFDVRAAGGVIFYTKSDLSTGVSLPANGGLSLLDSTAPISLNGSVGTTGQVLTSAGSGATPTWSTPVSAAHVVDYNVSSAQGGNTLTSTGANNLFNVAYASTPGTTTAGAVINSTTSGTNVSATGLTITASAGGTIGGTVTGMSVSATGGTANFAVNATAGNINLATTTASYQIGGAVILTAPGSDNLFAGTGAGATSGSAGDVTAIGWDALHVNTASQSTAVGSYALYQNGSATANTAMGFSAMYNMQTGHDNTAVGYGVFENNSSGSNNTAFGALAIDNMSGSNNTGIGFNVMYGVFGSSTGTDNTATGDSSFFAITTGSNNTASGANSGVKLTSGSNNAAIGYNALKTLTTGSQNTALGSGADVGGAAYSNATAIGYNAIAGGSNTIQLGNTSVTLVNTSGGVTAGGALTTGNSSTTGSVAIEDASHSYTTTLTTGTQSAGITYTLPTAAPISSGQVLASTTAGIMSWATALTSTTGVEYDLPTASTQNTSATGSDWLFNVAYSGSVTGSTAGARISSTAVAGSSTATGLTVSASGGTSVSGAPDDIALDVPSGAVLFSGTTGVTPASGAGTRMEWIPSLGALRAGYAAGTEWDAANIGQNSIGLGYQEKATGFGSVALGISTTASGQYSTALGASTTASGQSATAMGDGTLASGIYSTAMGNGCGATGNSATAMGINTLATGTYSTAIGFHATATGNGSTAIGTYVSTNNETGSFIYGDSSTNTNMNTTAPNQFDVRAAGGVNFYTDSGLTAGVSFPANGGLVSGVSGSTGTTGSIALVDASTNHTYTTAFVAGSQSANVSYTLPTAAPSSSGQVLASTTGGVMSWATALTSTSGVEYDLPTASTQNTSATGSDWLFNVAYNGSVTGSTAGAQITSTAVTGSSTATGLTVSASGGTSVSSGPDNIAIDVPSGAVLFSGTTGVTPTSASGTFFEWIPAQSALRAGAVSGTSWIPTNIGQYSAAFGYNTVASGEYSTAMGFTDTASGEYSTVMGYHCSASNYTSTAMGFLNEASGYVSTAMGYHSIANTNWTFAIGYYALASGQNAMALGTFTTASGQYSTAMGFSTTTTGEYSTAAGQYSEADGTAATALGYLTAASGNVSTAMGSFVSTNNKTGAFIYGDSSTATTMYATAANQFDVRAAGGVNFYTKSDLSTGVSFPANGGMTSGISGSSGSTGSISLVDASTNHTYTTTFTAGSQSANVSYTLPTAAPASSGQVLSSTTGGVMSWASVLTSSTGMEYDLPTASTQNTSATGTDWLFNVAYNGSVTGATAGAEISSAAATAASNSGNTAAGLTINAVASVNGTGSATATALALSATGGTTNNAINVESGNFIVTDLGAVTEAEGLTVSAGGAAVTGNVTSTTAVAAGLTSPASDVGIETKNGHIRSEITTVPTTTINANAGTSSSSSLAHSTDVAGLLSLATGTGAWAAGTQTTVNFTTAYTVAPIVVITPEDGTTASLMATREIYVQSTTGGFTLNFGSAETVSTSYNFYYHVIETQ